MAEVEKDKRSGKEKVRENGVCTDAPANPVTEGDVEHDDHCDDLKNPQLPGWFAEYSPLWPGLLFPPTRAPSFLVNETLLRGYTWSGLILISYLDYKARS